jgi:hypothetical protein
MSDPYDLTPEPYPPRGPTPQRPQQAPQMLGYAGLGTIPTLDNSDRAQKAARYLRIYAWFSIIAYVVSIPVVIATAMGLSIEDTGGGLLLIMIIPLGVLGCVALIIAVLAVVYYMMWQYRAYWNARALRFDPSLMTPGWSVGWWFIPIAHLFKPRRILRDLWSSTDAARTAARPNLPDVIYGCWIAYFIIGVAISLTFEIVAELNESDGALLVSAICDVVGGLIYIAFLWFLGDYVRIVQERQQGAAGWGAGTEPYAAAPGRTERF